jgi:hypothetical protein
MSTEKPDQPIPGQNQVVGLVFICNSILIFIFSFVISLGKSISDGTLMLCLIFLAIGTHLSLSEDTASKDGDDRES